MAMMRGTVCVILLLVLPSPSSNTGHLTLLVIPYTSAEAACMAQESRRWRAHWRSCPKGPESLTT